MTLDFTKLIENSIKKEMTVSHLDGLVKAQTVESLPDKVQRKISEQYGEKYLGDADYVVMFKGPFDRDDSGKLYKLTNRALGVDANRMTEEDFKFIKLDRETPWTPPQETDEAPYTPPADEVEPDDGEEVEAPVEGSDDEELDGDAGEFEPPADEVEPDDGEVEPDEEVEAPVEDDDVEDDDEDSDEDLDEEEKFRPPENPDDWKADRLDAGSDDWEAENDPDSRRPFVKGKASDVSEDEEDDDFEQDDSEESDDSADQTADQEQPVQKPLAFAFLKITMK